MFVIRGKCQSMTVNMCSDLVSIMIDIHYMSDDNHSAGNDCHYYVIIRCSSYPQVSIHLISK
jgi:hypothetical protein